MAGSLLARSVFSMRYGRLIVAAIVGMGLLAPLAVPARADCQEDIGKLMKRRLDAIALVNKAAKTAGGKLDPASACPKLRGLAAIESEASAYLQKNKDWCNVPGDFAEKMTASSGRTASIASKACSLAVMEKKMQEHQAQQQQEAAPKLPSGPL